VRVVLRAAEDDAVIAETRAERTGEFSFRGLRGDRRAHYVVAQGGGPGDRSAPFVLVPGGVAECAVLAPASGVVAGLALREGEPVPGAIVRLRPYSPATRAFAGPRFLERRSDRAGRFRFADVEPGTYVLQGFIEPTPVAPTGREFSVAPGETVARDAEVP
jgi:hypothetical protein